MINSNSSPSSQQLYREATTRNCTLLCFTYFAISSVLIMAEGFWSRGSCCRLLRISDFSSLAYDLYLTILRWTFLYLYCFTASFLQLPARPQIINACNDKLQFLSRLDHWRRDWYFITLSWIYWPQQSTFWYGEPQWVQKQPSQFGHSQWDECQSSSDN